MERPLLDARHTALVASTPAQTTSPAPRGSVGLFSASGSRERAVPTNPGLASFPHEDVEPMRVYPTACSVSNPASSATAGTAGFRSVSLPRWSPSPLTPRYLAAVTHQPPPPLGILLTSSAPGSGTTNVPSAEVGGSEAGSHYYHYSNEMIQTGSSLGGLSAAAAENANTSTNGAPMTMTSTLATLPLPMTRPLVIPPPPPAAAITTSTSVAPTRKRKRIPGAMRMRNFLCMHPGCGKSFTDSAHLRDHTVVHTGEKKLSCPTCNKLFARASTLQEHIRVHTGEKPYVCGVPGCSKCYSSRAAMRFHRSTHTAPATPFVCQECGKHFRVRELLMAHLKVHAAHRAAAVLTSLSPSGTARTVMDHENRYLQDTIRAQQDQIEQLKAEVLRLRGQTSLDATVAAVPALTAPVEMLRDGFKPFECCICHNRFANFYQLTFHGKQHPERPMTEVTGEQVPLPVGPKHCPEEECEYAESTGRSLRNLQTLKRHWQRRHQDERPYACSYCPATRQKTFKTRENLKAHEKDCNKNVPVR
ncbi:uncharacterized protein PITG_00050 [Phytophthora infestans T30-4]|uniref:C2H2-type domain-containing protein n=1 Tax=Phytophthora infestans (strain T30-4) TaxID=403677 RepID=D0MSR5_PHYIT|nr:uncharacterized protein PITG_00050 [Phytophthora infestans T30-4]EEY57499.1 conserved hypothetical protein [Phytophthora infestans T30-4]|eukprot:XP_002908685.1 conserved hypothetical protein [Phytophthora infestans T30-4]